MKGKNHSPSETPKIDQKPSSKISKRPSPSLTYPDRTLDKIANKERSDEMKNILHLTIQAFNKKCQIASEVYSRITREVIPILDTLKQDNARLRREVRKFNMSSADAVTAVRNLWLGYEKSRLRCHMDFLKYWGNFAMYVEVEFVNGTENVLRSLGSYNAEVQRDKSIDKWIIDREEEEKKLKEGISSLVRTSTAGRSLAGALFPPGGLGGAGKSKVSKN